MTDGFDWNEFRGDFWQWEHEGQSLVGDVLAIGIGTIDGRRYPELVLRTAEGDVTLSASQVQLSRKLADDPPGIGDRVAVVYQGEGPRTNPLRNPPKQFDVAVTHRGAVPPPAASAAPPASAPATPPPAASTTPSAADLI